MTTISHFIICYDHETGEFYLDSDSLFVHFPDGSIYEEENDKWIEPQDSDAPIVLKTYDANAENLLSEMLSNFNKD